MISAYVGLVAMAVYALSSYSQLRWFANNWVISQNNGTTKVIPAPNPALSTAVIAIVSHGIYVALEMKTKSGIDLSFFNVGCLVSLAINIAVLLSSIRQPVHTLFFIVFSIAILTIFSSMLVGTTATPRTNISAELLTHILMSIVAYSILALAACQAAVLLVFEGRLRRRMSLRFVRSLPPLETMETVLFQWLSTGLFLLTIAISSGFIFLYDQFSEHVTQHHTVLSMASWIVYTTIFIGHYFFGWRGNTTSRWILVGFVLLMTGYFGTKFIIEFILVRG